MGKKKIIVDILFQNAFEKKRNRFMRASDIIEKGKQLAEYIQITLPEDILDPEAICFELAERYKAAGGQVIFAGIKTINCALPDNRVYFMQGVQMISLIENGQLKRWCLFKDLLNHLGYTAEVDERQHVINVF